MKRVLCVSLFFLVAVAPAPAQHHANAPAGTGAVTLLPGLGAHHHPVSTANAEAQRFFDQGLVLVYAFNHEEAARSFRRAAELDPQSAMAYWGIALAAGPNYNSTTMDDERRKTADEAIRKAVALAANAPEHERAYIEAMRKRISPDASADQAKLSLDYKEALGALVRRYPDDLEAATLYADAAMILNAWKLWSPAGVAAAGTEEIVSVLESVLRRNPNHIGANHLYIHAVEASSLPERALASADRLGALAPAAGHLVHMPAHIYQRVGDYESSARVNDLAAKADRTYMEAASGGAHAQHDIYTAAYYSHNLHFLAAAYSMQGRFADALKAAEQLESNVRPRLGEMGFLEDFLPTKTLLLVRFRRWDDVLKAPQPAASLNYTRALWHWSRGLAHAATGKTAEAAAEQKIFDAAVKALPAGARFGGNAGSDVLKIAAHVLAARIAGARGDRKLALQLFRQAVEIEDSLVYSEPPDWYYPPTRESLGGALLAGGDYAEAERVFRADLERNRRNGRSLFGLAESLKGQGHTYAAALVRQEFERAWKNADAPLKAGDL
jgi:tetratricopeptide (TPR) repeat protein